MSPTVSVPRWSLLHLVLSVGLLDPPTDENERAELERCLRDCVNALHHEPEPVPTKENQ